MGRVERVFKISPSAVATWLECKRKWAWRHVAGIEVPQAPSAALGTEGHAQLEAYLGEETPIDFTKKSGYVVAAALPLLPAPKTPGLQLEQYFTYTAPSGLQYHGYMDVMGPDSSVFPKMPPPPPGIVQVPVVSDHKTTSNFAYAKSPEDLKKDPQGVIYAKVLFEKFPDAVYGDLIWTYALTRGTPKAKRVHLRVLKDDVEKQFALLELTAAEMAATYHAKTEPLALPPTLSACKMYGGCPHHPSKGGHCKDLVGVPTSLTGKTMSQDTKSMFDDLLARNPAGAATTPLGSFGAQAVTAPPPAAPATATVLPGVSAVPEGFQLPTWLTTKSDPGPAVTPPNTASNPPAQQVTLPFQATASAQQTFALPGYPTSVPINPPGEAAPVSSVLLPKPEATPEPVAGEKAKRVRRTKAQIEADNLAEAAKLLTQTALPVQAPVQVISEASGHTVLAYTPPAEEVKLAIPNTAIPGFVLYVDCVPDHGHCQDAHVIIQAAHDRVKAEAGVVDYRLVEYGKGAGALVACVAEAIAGLNYDVVLDSRTPEGALVLNTFAAKAGLVVRGLR